MAKLVIASFLLIVLILGAWLVLPPRTDAAPEWQSFAPPTWMLGPIQGADGKEPAVMDNLDTMRRWDIPITAFHFDAPDWQRCTGNAQLRYSDRVLDAMRAQGIRGLFWVVPLIGRNCDEYVTALANGYFVKDES